MDKSEIHCLFNNEQEKHFVQWKLQWNQDKRWSNKATCKLYTTQDKIKQMQQQNWTRKKKKKKEGISTKLLKEKLQQ